MSHDTHSRYGSYNPAAQLGMQPPSHQLEDPPLPALLTCQKPIIAQQSEKESLAEEGLLEAEDDSEVEEKGPNSNYILFGLDFKPLLPLFLAMSTLAGAICVLVVQIPMVGEFTPLGAEWLYGLYGAFSLIFVVTLVLMAYCAFIDPGQLQTPSVDGDIEHGLPQRAHKCWLYNRPIRRYDHYCKWLHNVIGLLNHREFVVMVVGLVLIAVLGAIIDIVLFVVAKKSMIQLIVVAHLGYSIGLFYIAAPILQIHCQLISRNELGQEWKKKEHFVAHNTSIGDNVPVEDLEDSEYNYMFDRDEFVYDPARNHFDKGFVTNCAIFWCQARWSADATGEF